jgi:hypothetical protein
MKSDVRRRESDTEIFVKRNSFGRRTRLSALCAMVMLAIMLGNVAGNVNGHKPSGFMHISA